MRIVGGRFKGRPLNGPASDTVRPTSDRLRETLFNILEHGYGGVAGTTVIDLFAGTGALAFEALSRGARFALLVDDGSDARAAIRSNIDALGLGGETRVFRRDARKIGKAPPGERFTMAFLDPPYGRALAEPTLDALRDGGWLAAEALIVIEEARSAAVTLPGGYVARERREFGDTQIVIAGLS